MLPDAAPQDAFDRLLRLPFVSSATTACSSTTRSARRSRASPVHGSGPVASVPRRRLAAAARRGARASSQEVWRYHRRPAVHHPESDRARGLLPSTEHLYSPEAARPADGAAIAEIVARWEPAASVAVLEAWWRREPTAFRVMRDRSGSIVGFHILADLDHLSHALLDMDPVARRCWDHLRRNPVPRGQRVLFNRCWMARDFGEAPSPVQAACWLDVKGRFMELRPDLRRIYSVVRDIATLGPMVAPSAVALLAGRPARRPSLLGGRARLQPVIDRRPAVMLIAAELLVGEAAILDLAEHQLVLDGRRVDLTAIEFPDAFLYQQPASSSTGDVAARGPAATTRRQQRHRGARRLAPAQAWRPIGGDRDGARDRLPVRALRRADPRTVRAGQATGSDRRARTASTRPRSRPAARTPRCRSAGAGSTSSSRRRV